MSNGKRTVRPIRQLSLQQPAPRRQHIRRQRSAEDDKSLQIYANPIARSRLATNGSEKPKVRIAWSDDRRDCGGDLERVEVVARQIPSRSKQTTSGRSGGRSYVGAEKASILYSRQELAERLRLAWKHREENRANIDIFLAHGFAVEERCDSELSMSASATPLPRKEPDSIQCPEKTLDWNIDAREKPSDSLGELKDDIFEDRGREIECEISNDELEIASEMTDNSMARKNQENVKAENAKEEGEEKKYVVNSNVEEKRRTRISIDCTSLHSPNPLTTPLKTESAVASTKIASDDLSSAKQKRASFHSGTNRAFLVPMVEKFTKKSATDKIVPVRSSDIRCASASTDKIVMQKQTTTTTDTRSPIVSDKNAVLIKSASTISLEKTRRTNSAPPQRRGGENIVSAARVQVNIVIDAPSLAEATSDKPIAHSQQGVKNTIEKSEENSAKIPRERTVRSAPLKRRSRSAKRRFLVSSETSGKDEEDAKTQDRCGRIRAYVDSKTTDVVTMVSLVSSADSDSDTENSPGDDKLISELRSKLPTTPIIKTSINPNHSATRKPIKSVSFQRYSFDEDPAKDMLSQASTRIRDEKSIIGIPARLNFVMNDHNDDMPPWRQKQNVTEDIPTPLIISTLLTQNDKETVLETAPLTDREKRCLAVPIGDLHDDKKRKLLRTRSIPNRPTVPEQTNNNAPIEIKEQRSPHFITGLVPPIDGRTICQRGFAYKGNITGRFNVVDGTALSNYQGKRMLASLQANVRQGSMRVL
ncbi:uncharacterized protein LOC116852450 isoform X2 [Odontomachus brunneus]|uniref:uncharacterized protein LOC116852450 isoform X2 n=1 Tax=Odontomachus brunneus TaxID=486640 RepID=UPI0013F1E276|nr:uncharacterized protein LOC116852450 isoform X2 [Odontomachus brunneus]